MGKDTLSLQETVIAQNELLMKLTSEANVLGTVLAIKDTRVQVGVQGSGVLELEKPKGSLAPGDAVSLNGQTKQIIETTTHPTGGAEIATVLSISPAGAVEIERQGGSRTIVLSLVKKLEPGTRVLLDATGAVVIKDIGVASSALKLSESPNVTWNSIGGLESTKLELKEIIESPAKHSALYAKYRRTPPKGILLWGPPGCGKTLLGKALATAIGPDAGFFFIAGPSVLSKWVGESEATIRGVFAAAAKHYEKTRTRAVIFIDEADALLSKRGGEVSSHIERTIVPTFLSEWDGLQCSTALVVLSTNLPNSLDEAILRPGRVDRKIKVPRPNRKEFADIAALYLSKVPLEEPLQVLANFLSETVEISALKKQISGALAANIVDRASSLAFREAVATNSLQGIHREHVAKSIKAAALEHTELL